jgi:hypothetical protein
MYPLHRHSRPQGKRRIHFEMRVAGYVMRELFLPGPPQCHDPRDFIVAIHSGGSLCPSAFSTPARHSGKSVDGF